MIFLCLKTRKPCYCVTALLMGLDYLQCFYLSILEKVKVFGNWKSVAIFWQIGFKKKMTVLWGYSGSLVSLGISLLSRDQLEWLKAPITSFGLNLLFFIYYYMTFISAYIIHICSVWQIAWAIYLVFFWFAHLFSWANFFASPPLPGQDFQ